MTRLQELREINKLSQAQMGEIIGKSQQFYQRYEKENTKLPIELAIIFANYFDVSLDYLCDRQYNNNIGYIPDERKDLVKKLLTLNDRQAEKVESYMTALIDND